MEFILSDAKVQDFLEWIFDTNFPEEIFFQTIQHNPHLGAPGAYTGMVMPSMLICLLCDLNVTFDQESCADKSAINTR